MKAWQVTYANGETVEVWGKNLKQVASKLDGEGTLEEVAKVEVLDKVVI